MTAARYPAVARPRGETDDGPSLVLLIQQHEAGMHAAALGILGHSADSEDAVQDATLTAVSRIGELRDPALAGAWLRAIVRNRCLMQLRSRRDVPVTADDLPLASG
jgi:DNA-directed RNA polymerase specialized sigma24 family protein